MSHWMEGKIGNVSRSRFKIIPSKYHNFPFPKKKYRNRSVKYQNFHLSPLIKENS